MKRLTLALALSVISGGALAGPPKLPPEPAQHPDFAKAAKHAVDMLVAELFDPSSARITWRSGFQWGYFKPILEARHFGWIACGDLNAKNRMGGYTGAQRIFLFLDETGRAAAATEDGFDSTCEFDIPAPVNPELIAASPGATSTPAFSVADELEKLLKLRDSGALTQAEFDAQKAKLLSH